MIARVSATINPTPLMVAYDSLCECDPAQEGVELARGCLCVCLYLYLSVSISVSRRRACARLSLRLSLSLSLSLYLHLCLSSAGLLEAIMLASSGMRVRACVITRREGIVKGIVESEP